MKSRVRALAPAPMPARIGVRRDDDNRATKHSRQDFGVLESEFVLAESELEEAIVLVAEFAPEERLAKLELLTNETTTKQRRRIRRMCNVSDDALRSVLWR